VRAAAAAPSRRQQSKWQREQHQQRTLFVAVGTLIGLILAVFLAGFVYDNFIRANEVVAVIGTDNVTANQLIDEMQPAIRALQAQSKQYATSGASSTQLQQYITTQKRDLPDQTLNSLIDKRLIRQEATQRGIGVTSAEVDDKMRQTVADYQNATNPAPTAEPTPLPEAASPLPTDQPTPTAAPPTTPTAVPTLEGDAYTSALSDLLTKNNVTESDVRDNLEQNLLQDKLQKAIGEDKVPATQEQIHARHILVSTEDQALDVLTQLQSGVDFASLAQQLSTDPATKDKGGDQGWVGRGTLDKAVEDAAFGLQPGQLSDVIKSASGYEVVQVMERDPARTIPADQLDTQRRKAYSDWLASRRTSSDVKLQLSQSERDWVLGRIGVRP
jgi:parvulin-like peptidyl-prolyl isomerase